MDLEEIKKYLEENKDNNDVVDLIKSFQHPLTRDVVEQWCQDGDGRSWLDRNCDIYATKAVNTARENAIAKFKEEELPKLIENAVKEATNKELTPEQIQLKELQEQLDAMKADKEETLRIEANRTKLKENKLDEGLAKYINSDEDLDYFKQLFYASVEQNLKDNSPKPEKSEGLNNVTDPFLKGLGF